MRPDRTGQRIASFLSSPAPACAAALALRVCLLWLSYCYPGAQGHFPIWGSEERRVAWSLATGNGFSAPFRGYSAATAWLAPAYPFLWAVCMKLLGLKSPSMLVGQSLNCLFSALTCWPIYSIGKSLFEEKVGLASAWLWAWLPQAIWMPVMWAWDQNLAALTLALIVAATLKLRESTASLGWTGYGLLWAFAALVNPALCSLLPFCFVWLIHERRLSGLNSPGLYAKAAFLFVLALLPWTIRNYYTVGGWIFVKSNFGVELWLGNHDPSITGDVHPMNSSAECIRLIFQGEADYGREDERKAMQFIKAHPGSFLKNSWSRFRATWMPANDMEINGWTERAHFGWPAVWYCALFSILSFAGLILAARDDWAASLPLAVCLAVVPLPYYITHSDLRYRHPVDPFMAILAAYCILRLWALFSPRPVVEKAQELQSV